MERRLWQKVMVGVMVLLILTLLLTIIPARAQAPAKPIVLGFESYLPSKIPEFAEFKRFYKGLEDATGGLVKTEFRMAGVMGKTTETYNRVVAGTSEIGHFNPGYTPGVFPMWEILQQPILVPSAEVMTRAMFEMYKKGYFDKEFANIKLIEFRSIGPYQFFSREKKITTVEDIKGLKIRAPTEGHAEVVKALGGVPVSMTAGEIYGSLQKGIIDVDFNICDGILVFKVNEVTKYFTEIRLLTVGWITVMNKNTWEALPKAGKAYIDKNWEEHLWAIAKSYDANERPAKERYLATPGREILSMAPGESAKMEKLIAPIWDKWIAGIEAKGLPGKKAAADLYKIMKGLGVEKSIVGYTPG